MPERKRSCRGLRKCLNLRAARCVCSEKRRRRRTWDPRHASEAARVEIDGGRRRIGVRNKRRSTAAIADRAAIAARRTGGRCPTEYGSPDPLSSLNGGELLE